MSRRATISLTGDICPTRRLTSLTPDHRVVLDAIGSADLAIGNLEMPLSDKGFPLDKLLNIRAAPGIAEDIPLLGVHVVTLANNHAVDYGWEALDDTSRRVERAGVATIGSGIDSDAANAAFHADAGGTKIGVVAFSCLTPAGSTATATRPGIAAIRIDTAYEVDPLYQVEEPGDLSVIKVRTSARPDDLAHAVDVVRRLRATCDLVVVTLHWGFGSGEAIAQYQRPVAEALIDAGAGIIHGHHPHAIHAVGFYRGSPIFFSSGTLVGQQIFLPASDQVQAMWADMSPDGFVSLLEIVDGAVVAVRLVPHTLDSNRLPVPAQGAVFDRIHDRLRRLSAAQGATITAFEGGLDVRSL